MIQRTLEQIKSMLGSYAEPLNGLIEGSIRVSGVSTDTRTIEQGNLFVPLIGDNFDGHAYAEEAYSKGAVAALWQADRPNPPQGMPIIQVNDTLAAIQQLAKAYRLELPVRIIGITGSNGKTTTKDMVAAVLSTTYKVHKTKGNLNNHIGLPLTLLQLEEDTAYAVVEMGMSGRGEIELLSELAEPEAAIVTMIGEAHMLQLGSRKEIARAKLEILSGLRSGGLLVYNGDEPLIEQVMQEVKATNSVRKLRFGKKESNELYPIRMEMDAKGTHFNVNQPDYPDFYIPLWGTHNVINALAAIGIAQQFGVTPANIAVGLHSLQMTSMRIEKLSSASGLIVLNDAYNASPASMRAALQLVEQLTGYNRKIVVLGDMLELGAEEDEFHRSIGRELSAEKIDYIFTFGRLAHHIAEEALQSFGTSRVYAFDDKQKLIDTLSELAKPDDLVLVKGSRGMRLEQVVQSLLG
jgi:UDP-N-acetylmuramoyl-tripeptide--D-alanyl-D-alanine ligase